MLLLYATTGDFMATSMLFVDGHDCDHPLVRIEHKCEAESARTKQVAERLALAIASMVVPAVCVDGMTLAAEHVPVSEPERLEHDDSDNAVPLRC
jgi:hypothetical protein